MSKKLTNKSEVIEWYWPDFLDFCLRSRKFVEDMIGDKNAPT